MATLLEKFRGCLLGAAIGDVAGAVVEAESPGYIAKTYRSIDDILAAKSIPEFTGPDWVVGRFTDDTQMTICVAEWLLADQPHSPQKLLERFAAAYEPWRRYGPGTEGILRLFPKHRANWRELSTAMFPHGSYGNGGAMRVAPIGLAYHRDIKTAVAMAIESSRVTHSHWLACQDAAIQSAAVAMAGSLEKIDPIPFAGQLKRRLQYFDELMQDISKFSAAFEQIEAGLKRAASCAELAEVLGTGIAAHEAVPMALYCFLRHPNSYEDVIHHAIFIGGDTDTIACMAGAISGAYLGRAAIPQRWTDAIIEEEYSAAMIEKLADRLYESFAK